jgi:competence protein ComEC
MNFQYHSKNSKNLAVNIFSNKKEYLLFGVLIFLIFTSSLFLKYIEFQKFTKFDISTQKVFVEQQYWKKDKFILKLRTENGFRFYTSSKEKIINLQGFLINIDIKIYKSFTFFQYLSGTFLFTKNISIASGIENRYKITEYFKKIHQNEKIAELYSTLFLATPISKNLREDLGKLGVSHLAVLSGFHTGFIIGFIFMLSYIFYKPIHKYFMPYRNLVKDTAIFSIFVITGYLIFLGNPPSFLRAVSMFLISFLIFDRNLLKSKFEVLFLAVIILIAFQPTLIFSLGFWFSVSGVFYILLYLKYIKLPIWIDIFLINLWVFLAMLPIVHFIFPIFYFAQLLSPIWTILFSIFYPISAVLHIVGYPALFDEVLSNFLNCECGKEYQFKTPLSILILYLGTSIYFAFRNFSKNEQGDMIL